MGMLSFYPLGSCEFKSSPELLIREENRRTNASPIDFYNEMYDSASKMSQIKKSSSQMR